LITNLLILIFKIQNIGQNVQLSNLIINALMLIFTKTKRKEDFNKSSFFHYLL
jgi:hypothetical protein